MDIMMAIHSFDSRRTVKSAKRTQVCTKEIVRTPIAHAINQPINKPCV